jgi:hypothetical protein
MVLQLFQVLFVVTLAGLVLAVPVGLLALAWPRGKRTHETVVPYGASARA